MSWDIGMARSAELMLALAWHAVTLTLSTLVLSLATVAAYRLFFHPLARVPGPRIAAVSNVWYAMQIRNGRAAHLAKTLHQKYGPVVRVGPNELWFNSMEACRAIYNAGSGFEKADFYLATTLSKPTVDWRMRPSFPDALDLLSELDVDRYRLQRRLIGPVYQTSSLLRHEAAVDEVLARAVERLRELGGAPVDLKEWMHMVAVECLGAVVLSWSPGMLRKGTDSQSSAHSYQGWRRKSVMGLFPWAVRLEFWSKSFGRAFSVVWGLRYKTPENFRPFFPDVNRKVSRRVTSALKPNPPKESRSDLLADLIQLHREKPQFTEPYLRKMAVTNFGAGHETMASTLTSVVAMVASHPDVHRQVAAEIRQGAGRARPRGQAQGQSHGDGDANADANGGGSGGSLSYARAASSLAYTRAAVSEAKRLHPVVCMSLARRAPAPLRLHGHVVPAGTTVGCSPVALHRNEEVCGLRPDAYEPSRWLGGDTDNDEDRDRDRDRDTEAARRMERYSLAWGGGARTCPGRNLAEMIVLKTVAAVFAAFDVEIDEMPPEDERPTYFLGMLVGVKARFVEAGKAYIPVSTAAP